MDKNIIDHLPTDVLIKGYSEDRIVTVSGTQLLPDSSQKFINHSPDGFSWGYGGSGPAQLALAILLIFMDIENARNYYQQFKWNVVAKWPKDDFEISLNLKEEIQKIISETHS